MYNLIHLIDKSNMNRFSGTRKSYAKGARRMLGHTSSGIQFLGRANNFAKGLGISNPVMDKGVGMLEKYGLPTANFLQNELGNGD